MTGVRKDRLCSCRMQYVFIEATTQNTYGYRNLMMMMILKIFHLPTWGELAIARTFGCTRQLCRSNLPLFTGLHRGDYPGREDLKIIV